MLSQISGRYQGLNFIPLKRRATSEKFSRIENLQISQAICALAGYARSSFFVTKGEKFLLKRAFKNGFSDLFMHMKVLLCSGQIYPAHTSPGQPWSGTKEIRSILTRIQQHYLIAQGYDLLRDIKPKWNWMF